MPSKTRLRLNNPWLSVTAVQSQSGKALRVPAVLKDVDCRFYPALQELISKVNAKESIEKIIDWTPDLNIEIEWYKRNSQYGFFSENTEARDLYVQLLRAIYGYARLYEHQMIHDESIVHDCAYKLMALYVSDPIPADAMNIIATQFDCLSKSFPSGSETPLHDALVTRLANLPYARSLFDRAGWRDLIRANTPQSLDYFSRAVEIESANHLKAPTDMKQAQEIVMRMRYKRALEDVPFAELCHHYKVAEGTFNAALDYMQTGWPKKRGDALPNITVKQGQLSWSKLSVDDKRALVLGQITDCCQSIGGHSARCVKDAVSLPLNGLYVLKDKEKIIGQAYVWMSNTGNLCLDSVECLSNSVRIEDLRTILAEFSAQVLAHHPNIKRVVIGQGGKTPENLFSKTAIPERMQQGYFYGDATHQYLIAHRGLDISNHPDFVGKYPSTFLHCIDYLSDYLADTSHVVEELDALLKENPELISAITPERLKRLIKYTDTSIQLSLLQLALPEEASTDAQRMLGFDLSDIPRCVEILGQLSQRHLILAVKERNENNETVLHQVVSNPELFKAILELLPQEARLEAVKVRGKYGYTMLHRIARNPELLTATLELLPQGTLLDVLKEREDNDNTVLHLASKNPESFKAISALLPKTSFLEAVKEKNRHGETVLDCAANNPESLKFILSLLPFDSILDLLNVYTEESFLNAFREAVLQKCEEDKSLIEISKQSCTSADELKELLLACIDKKHQTPIDMRSELKSIREAYGEPPPITPQMTK